MQIKSDAGTLWSSPRTFRAKALLAVVHDRWFIRLRWIILFATFALLVFEHLQSPGFRRPPQLFVCLLALAAINIAWTILGRRLIREITSTNNPHPLKASSASAHTGATVGQTPRESWTIDAVEQVAMFVNAQMAIDLLFLTIILRYSGGIENPMAVFYLFHMLLAALLLKPVNAFLQGIGALFLYAMLLLGECEPFKWIEPHYPFLVSMSETLLHEDQTYVIVSITVLAAGIFGILFFTRQISARLDEQEQELEQTIEDLQRSQIAIQDLQTRRSRFMLTAAHQLKSPVAGIEMLANLIRDSVVGPEGIPGVVDRIIQRCRGAIGQVGELLTLARIEDAAPARHQSSLTDVIDIIRRIINKFTDQIKAKDIELTVSTSDVMRPNICVEERDLEDCIGNLVENAIKYTPKGGKIWVTATCNAQTTSISVKDTGMGIAEVSEDSLFDPFRRGKLALAASIPGTGLGLAIVREVVEQANGRVEVQSTVGKGSEFVVSFPRPDSPGARPKVRGTRLTTIKPNGSSAEHPE